MITFVYHPSSKGRRLTTLLLGFAVLALPGSSFAQWVARCPSCARHLGGSGVAGPYSSKELCEQYVARMRSQGYSFSDCEPQAGRTSSGTPATVTLPPVVARGSDLDKKSLEQKAQRAAAIAALTANGKGMEAYERGDWEAGLRFFEEATRLDPSEPAYSTNLARAEERLAQARQATPEESDFFYKLQLRMTGPPEPTRKPRSEFPAPDSHYRPSGHGLLFGTGAIFGMRQPEGSEALRREATRRLEEQKVLAGLTDEERRTFVDTAEYNLLIGIASFHDSRWDLFARVLLGDEFTKGAHSAGNQPLYASLKGRQFDLLDCHSNGAMVCLAALRLADVEAPRVRLFGPQITPDALSAWQTLVDTGRVESVQLYLNRGDPISHASYLFADLSGYLMSFGVARPPVPALSYEALAERIARSAPGIEVTLLDDCGEKNALGFDLSFRCHAMARYQSLVDGVSRH